MWNINKSSGICKFPSRRGPFTLTPATETCVMVDSLHPLNGKSLGGGGSGRSQMCVDGCRLEEGVDALPPSTTRCGTYSVITRNYFHLKAAAV